MFIRRELLSMLQQKYNIQFYILKQKHTSEKKGKKTDAIASNVYYNHML